MQAFDAIGKELFLGDSVAFTQGGGNYGAGITVGRIVRIFQGTGVDSKTVKVSVEIPYQGWGNDKGTWHLEKKPANPKVKCIKMEGFDFDAYFEAL